MTAVARNAIKRKGLCRLGSVSPGEVFQGGPLKMKGPKIQVISKSIISRGSLGVTIILRLFQKGFDRILGETQIILGRSLAWLNFSSLFGWPGIQRVLS